MATKSFLENFAQGLRDQDRSDNTVLGYLTDVKDFQRWFVQTNGENFSLPALTPPTSANTASICGQCSSSPTQSTAAWRVCRR